jgi:hypothetical protein
MGSGTRERAWTERPIRPTGRNTSSRRLRMTRRRIRRPVPASQSPKCRPRHPALPHPLARFCRAVRFRHPARAPPPRPRSPPPCRRLPRPPLGPPSPTTGHPPPKLPPNRLLLRPFGLRFRRLTRVRLLLPRSSRPPRWLRLRLPHRQGPLPFRRIGRRLPSLGLPHRQLRLPPRRRDLPRRRLRPRFRRVGLRVRRLALRHRQLRLRLRPCGLPHRKLRRRFRQLGLRVRWIGLPSRRLGLRHRRRGPGPRRPGLRLRPVRPRRRTGPLVQEVEARRPRAWPPSRLAGLLTRPTLPCACGPLARWATRIARPDPDRAIGWWPLRMARSGRCRPLRPGDRTGTSRGRPSRRPGRGADWPSARCSWRSRWSAG